MQTNKISKKSRGVVFVELLLWLAFVTLLALPAILMIGINVSYGFEQIGVAAYDASNDANNALSAIVSLSGDNQVSNTAFTGVGDPSTILGGSGSSGSSGSSSGGLGSGAPGGPSTGNK